ncbi:MAG: N-acetylmuramoyl-L-alanine amidase [Intestinibacter sp.]|uniref:N-acetylmuramoyl-L-alanine amidase n=1 Tax=Intestinibacter sp. TaxID=1965304 RepID=UPI002A82D5D6|nr:N-acetylmuramoyl-L-alanine amidase [Intestinibacter sp.]MDY4575531.1 N-acetylmuramoyl-L-alanine amidase [Intestinibacter sp.]
MRKKTYLLLVLLIISLVSFGCNKSNVSSSENTSTTSDTSQQDSDKSSEKANQDKSQQDKNKKEGETTEEEKQKNKNQQYIICIDPGHQTKGDMSEEPVGPGSSETKFKVSWGTQGVSTNIPEYELNLQASKILKQYLEDMGFKVIMTRETNDVNITNSERAIFANENNADLVIRIHADGSEDSSVNGASLHIPASNGKYTAKIYEESNKCAKIIFSDMKEAGFKVNNIYERSDLTGFNWSEVPAVLVEMGFMSNPEEDEKMAEKSYQEKMMKAVAEATQTYFDGK